MKVQIKLQLIQISLSLIACINGIIESNLYLLILCMAHLVLNILLIILEITTPCRWKVYLVEIFTLLSQLVYIEFTFHYRNEYLILINAIQFNIILVNNDQNVYYRKWFPLIISILIFIRIIINKQNLNVILSGFALLFLFCLQFYIIKVAINSKKAEIITNKQESFAISSYKNLSQNNQFKSLSKFRSKSLKKNFTVDQIKQQKLVILCGSEIQGNQNQLDTNIFNLLPFGLIIIDQKKEINYVSDKCFKLLESDDILSSLKQCFKKSNELKLSLKKKQFIRKLSSQIMNGISQDLFDNLLTKSYELSEHNLDMLDVLLNSNEQGILNILREIVPQGFQSQILSQDICSIKSDRQQQQNILYMEQTQYFINKNPRKLHFTLAQSLQDQVSLIIIIEDITKKKNYQEIHNRLKFQEQLLLSFSHELKTPLNCAIQSLTLAMSSNINQYLINSCIRPAYISNLMLMFQLNDILDFAAFQSLNFSYNFIEFKFDSLVEFIKSLYSLQANEKKIDLQYEIQEEISQTLIKSDQQRIQQIIVNLLNNAIRYTPEMGVIVVSIKNSLKTSNEYYKITVRDNGNGIPAEKFEIIKQKLEESNQLFTNQIMNEIENDIKILGLGFKISNKIVSGLLGKQEQNWLKIKNLNPGFQVSFCIKNYLNQSPKRFGYMNSMQKQLMDLQTIVLEQNSPQEDSIQPVKSIQVSNQTLHQQQSLKNKKIEKNIEMVDEGSTVLIVDDEPFNHLPLKGLMKQYNIDCDSAYNGLEAIVKVEKKMKDQQKCYKLIFMDIQMPIKDGLSAVQEIVDFFKQNQIRVEKRSKIIMCSAFDNLKNMRQSEKFGATYFLAKPVTKQSLHEIIENYYQKY